MTVLRPPERDILRLLRRESPLSYAELMARVPSADSIHVGWLQNQGLIAEFSRGGRTPKYALTASGLQHVKD